MKVAFDLSGLKSKNPTGVGTYIINLLKNLNENTQVELEGAYRLSRYKNRKTIQNNSCLNKIKPIIPFLPVNYSIFHGTDFWLPKYGKFKKIVTIHDLAIYHTDLYEPKLAKYFQKRYENTLLRHNPDQIVVVSNFIKNEFLNFFPKFENQITVVPHGTNHYEKSTISNPIYDFDYIVCLGTIEKRKNIANLYRAFKIVKQTYKQLKLVLIGGMGYQDADLAQIITEMQQDSQVVLTGYLSNRFTQNIVSNALISVYPSEYEGFGFPILEPMCYGVPVITSNFGSMNEVSADAALVCNTKSVEELANSILYMLDNESIRKYFIAKGYNRTKMLTWKKCAEETIRVYKNVF